MHPVPLHVGSLCLTCSMLLYVRCLTCMPCTIYMCGVCLTHPVLFVCVSLAYSYTPCAILCGEFVLHTLCCFMWECVTHPALSN